MNKAARVVAIVFGVLGCLLFVNPSVAGADTIYVANASSETIEEFTQSGNGSLFVHDGGPMGIAFDNAGNLYTADYGDNMVFKFNSNGVESVFANAGLDEPFGIAFDRSGNLYVSNYGNNTIEKFGTNGVGTVFGTNDLTEPTGLAFDASGNLYAANYQTGEVTKFDTNGVASVFVGFGGLTFPVGLAFDKSGNLYGTSSGNNTIYKFGTTGARTVFANAGLNEPYGLAFDSSGNLYVANIGNNSVEKFTTNGVGTVFATNGLSGPSCIAVQQPWLILDCPSSITVNTDSGKCTASNVNLGTPFTESSCSGAVTLTNNAPSVFPRGTNFVVWTAIGPCGNSATCTQTVIVVDSQAPTISYPAPVTVSCASTVPSANTASVTASDNCGSVTVSFVGDIITNQTCPNRYTVLRTYQATDASGNSATCTQTITVNATNPPTIAAPANVTVNTDSGQCTASNVSLGSPTASSFCGDALTVTSNAPAVFPKGVTEVIWSTTDTCGNSAAATQTVLVVDNQAPAIVCPGNILANAMDFNGATVTFSVIATDNCDSNLTVNCSPLSGSEFAVGTTPVNCVVVDSSGNSNTCSFSVTVVDSSVFNILSITPQGSNILLSWIMPLGFTGVVQGTAGAADGSYSSNFTDVSSPFYAPGNGIMTNSYLDSGALTNSPSWYYRIRLMP
jgi:hypothetical protein